MKATTNSSIQNPQIKNRAWLCSMVCAALALSIGTIRAQVVVSPPNYSVTTPQGFQYSLNGTNPTAPAVSGTDDSIDFSLSAGATYIFSMNTASFHPVDICTNSSKTARYTGASAQAVSSGSVTVTIPASNYPPTLYYLCDIHQFYGKITVNPPQPPPAVNILKTLVTTNILLTFSGGTNTIPVTPQYSSNLVTGAWQNVPSYTNTFSGNGTNTTSFGRLDAICGPNVFLRISQVAN